MKKGGLISLFILMSAALSAQIRIVPRERLEEVFSPQLSADSAALVFERTAVDAPSLKEDSAPVCIAFPLRNASERTVSITRMVSSCSCLRTDIPDPKLLPGEESVITAIYSPEGHPGKFERRIFVYTEASEDHPAAVLTVRAEVAESGNPLREYPFRCGSLLLARREVELSGRQETVSIRCFNPGSAPLRISAETAFVPFPVSVRVEPGQIEAGETGRIVMEIDPGEKARGEYPVIVKGTGGRPSESRIILKIK